MSADILRQAMDAEPGELVSGSADDIRAIAQQGFFDGLRMAAAITDHAETKAKLWALLRNAPSQSPPV